jgi:hypothetical protein
MQALIDWIAGWPGRVYWNIVSTDLSTWLALAGVAWLVWLLARGDRKASEARRKSYDRQTAQRPRRELSPKETAIRDECRRREREAMRRGSEKP